jgi:hypothetical protein
MMKVVQDMGNSSIDIVNVSNDMVNIFMDMPQVPKNVIKGPHDMLCLSGHEKCPP